MRTFSLLQEQEWRLDRHVEKALGADAGGDHAVACWEPGQVSPHHCHPHATEIYFCFDGGGTMRAGDDVAELRPGRFVVHPPGELHEFENGARRTLLFRVRYGTDLGARVLEWRGRSDFVQSREDADYFARLP